MSASFITFDDVYLILKPVIIDFDMIFLAVFLFIILQLAYKFYETKISKAKYMFISFLIVLNSVFLPMFIGRINKEVGRFSGLARSEAVKEIVSEDVYNLYDYLKTNVKTGEKVFLNDISDPYHENVRVKLRLAYYLAPTLISDTIENADYAVIVNYQHKPQFDIKFPDGKTYEYKSFSKELAVVKIIDTNKAAKDGVK